MPATWPCNGHGGNLDPQTGLAVLAQGQRLPSRPAIMVFREAAETLPTSDGCRFLLGGAWCFLEGDDVSEIGTRLQECLRVRRLASPSEGSPLWEGLRSMGLVGSSPALNQVVQKVDKAAQLSDVTVLITGPSGTGKQLLAEAIHRFDAKRSGHPFITVNCGAVSPTLAESELFGHRRGAFTDATTDRRGCFRAADRGTLFLDEIGETDLSLQPKLLRVLEQKRIPVLGQDAEVSVDVRVIAATNRDLPTLVAQGRFRLDLYHRLHVLTIEVPSLSERPEDLRPLVEFFVQKHGDLYPGPIEGIDPRVFEVLAQSRWEGNVRELENLVQSMLFKKQQGRRLALEDLPKSLLDQAVAPPQEMTKETLSTHLWHLVAGQGFSLKAALNHCERLLVDTALQQAGENPGEAARRLKIPRRSFSRKRGGHPVASSSDSHSA